MRRPYPSDLIDEQLAIVETLIPIPTVGRPRTNDMREVLNAIFYFDRSGCQRDKPDNLASLQVGSAVGRYVLQHELLPIASSQEGPVIRSPFPASRLRDHSQAKSVPGKPSRWPIPARSSRKTLMF